MNEKFPNKAQINADIERAEAIQKQMRKEAPDGSVKAPFKDPRDRQVRLYVPTALGESRNPQGPKFKIIGGEGAKESVRYTAMEKYRERINQGWVPVLDETGQIVQQGGDILMKRDIEFSRRQTEIAGAESKKRVKMKTPEEENNDLMDEYKKSAKKRDPDFGDGTTVVTGTAEKKE